jgi:hypothetical protein
MSSNLPKIQDLYNDRGLAKAQDTFVTLLNQPPKAEWVKVHPFIKGYKYLPIERVEFLLKTIFKHYRIEVTGQGTAFNGVWVTVRVHYKDPISGEWSFHDGIGASQIQTKKGASAADMANINNNAVGLAFPMAKTEALKNACKSFGKLFGSDLNKADDIAYTFDLTLIDLDELHPNWEKVVKAVESGNFTIEQIKQRYNMSEEIEEKLLLLQKK